MARPQIQPRSFSAGHPENRKRFFYRLVTSQRFLAIIGLSLLLIIAIPLAKTYSQKKLVEKELADLQAGIAQFEQENGELQEMIKYLESDQSLESQARLNLNLKKPEESVVVIERLKDTDSQLNGNKVINQDGRSNFKKWRQYFFDT